jgi:hypothetical protein
MSALALVGTWSVLGRPLPALGTATRPLVSSGTPAVDPRALVVGASELGPDWSVSRESTAGSTADLGVYEVEYANSAAGLDRTIGFSVFSAASTAEAHAGLEQLRLAAESRGVVFESFAGLTDEQPSLRGRSMLAGDPQRISIVHLFQHNTVVAIVEAIGPSTLETDVRSAAESAARQQGDRLVAASAR